VANFGPPALYEISNVLQCFKYNILVVMVKWMVLDTVFSFIYEFPQICHIDYLPVDHSRQNT
jgi:hypothetical protein